MLSFMPGRKMLTACQLHELLSSVCLGNCQQRCSCEASDGACDCTPLASLPERLGGSLQGLVPAACAQLFKSASDQKNLLLLPTLPHCPHSKLSAEAGTLHCKIATAWQSNAGCLVLRVQIGVVAQVAWACFIQPTPQAFGQLIESRASRL